jgi:hypothetical protein
MDELRTAREEQSMPPQAIENRVDHLERRVTELEKLPERLTAVESQIVQLRTEMRDQFSAVRQEIRAGDEETRRLMTAQDEETRRLMIAGDEETRRFMRVLHEEVIGRFATFQERQPATRRKRKDK